MTDGERKFVDDLVALYIEHDAPVNAVIVELGSGESQVVAFKLPEKK